MSASFRVNLARLLALRDVYLAAVAAVRSQPRKTLATGGIVARPTLAMFAEHGPVMVIPFAWKGLA